METFPPIVEPKFNYLYNGSWQVDQVKEGATAYTVAGGAGVVQCIDGMKAQAIGAGTFTVQQVADPDNAAQKAIKAVCTVIDGTIAAGDLYYLEWSLEGERVRNLLSGTSAAKSITIKFDASFTLAGTYGISIANSASNRSYVGTIVVSVTTNQTYTVTLQLDTTGTWLYTAGTTGLRVRFTLAAGSTYQGTALTWGATNLYTTSAQANFMATATTNIINIKPIQLVEGTVAGDIMPRGYGDVLRDCQRFRRRITNGLAGFADSTTQAYLGGLISPPMAVAPTITLVTTTPQISQGGASFTGTASAINDSVIAADSFLIRVTGFTGLVANGAALVRMGAGGQFLDLDCRL